MRIWIPVALTSLLSCAHAPSPASTREIVRAQIESQLARFVDGAFVLAVPVCHACGGPLRILAVLPEGEATLAILEHLGLPTTARGPRAHGPPGGLVVGSNLGGLKRFCRPPPRSCAPSQPGADSACRNPSAARSFRDHAYKVSPRRSNDRCSGCP